MLMTAIDRLTDTASGRQYKEAAELMGAVNQLLTYFEDYAKVPKIRDLAGKSRRLESSLEAHTYQHY